MHQALEDLDGVAVIADDILVIRKGQNDEEARRDHDENLEKLMKICQEKSIKLNEDKVRQRKIEILYKGHCITAQGIRPDLRKVDAINQLKTPRNTKQLKEFLGMVSYLSKFLPCISDETSTLR